ncbi:MAG: DUF3429 family protein [Deinococcus-Thermus bacterium]|jgi:hypothetical protein|nr:DUF3429 family protein [Deinococcota bacterium]
MLTFAQVPRSALALGLAGLLPFLWGVATLHFDPAYRLTMDYAGPRFVGPFVLLSYGTIILAFMSGVLWGFAARASGAAQALGLGLSVLPALWAFFFVGSGPVSAAMNLIAGFLAVLLIDVLFWANGLAPRWWMALRIPLTAVVCACLAPVAFG